MRMFYPLRGRFLAKFLIILGLIINYAKAQDFNPPLHNAANKERLNAIEGRAKDLVAKNMNRLALDRLKIYDFWLDSLYQREKQDTLANIENSYRTASSGKLTTIAKYKKQITELTAKKTKLDSRYKALVKKAVFSFVLWLVIVLLVLAYRKRKFKSVQIELEAASAQVLTLEETISKSSPLFDNLKTFKSSLDKLNPEYSLLTTIVSEFAENNETEKWKDLRMKSAKLQQQLETEDKVITAVLSQSESINDEKISTDINALCEQYVEIAARGFRKTDDFNIQVTRDFEKRLPEIKVTPGAVGSLLLNILMNAFQSVKEKSKKGIKGYQPKVSISTRILPRFLQIRIRDNGTGMNESILQQATKEFFSTRELNEGPGLGLYFANQVISEMHKGEIKIESEEGNSTDVYIKFFIV